METITVEHHLKAFRELNGEEAWRSEVHRLALAGICTGPKHEAFWQEFTKDFEWLDWAALKQQAVGQTSPRSPGSGPMRPDQMMAEMLRKQMPGIKTQAQYDAVVGSLDAVRLVVNAILEGGGSKEAEARQALEMTFTVLAKATEVTNKLEDSPEAASSPAAEKFKAPPAQFQEQEVYSKLMGELETLGTLDALNFWYGQTKPERDRVVTQSLRNSLMDSIRAKRNGLV
jgi:hypothetical protein